MRTWDKGGTWGWGGQGDRMGTQGCGDKDEDMETWEWGGQGTWDKDGDIRRGWGHGDGGTRVRKMGIQGRGDMG